MSSTDDGSNTTLMYIPICDWLLAFWEKAVAIALECQQKVVAVCEQHAWNSTKTQQWLDALLLARKHGRATSEQIILLQHEQIIVEQIGWTQQDDSNNNKQRRYTLTPLVAQLAAVAQIATLSRHYLSSASRQLGEQQQAMYLLIAANYGAELYLNVAFGVLLQSTYDTRYQTGVGVSYDADRRYVLERVQLVHGSVACAKRCVPSCPATQQKKAEHLPECLRRDAVWLLLTVVDTEQSERRQVHLDVAAVRYGFNDCVPGAQLPLRCGFVPCIETTAYKHFESRNCWPMAGGRDRYAPPIGWDEIVARDTACYVIDKLQPIMDIMAHYNTVFACNVTYPLVAPKLEFAARIYKQIWRCSRDKKGARQAIALVSELKSHDVTREQAAKAQLELDALRIACIETVCVHHLMQKMQGSNSTSNDE